MRACEMPLTVAVIDELLDAVAGPECGSPLTEVAASERRERRIVTIVFADLAGFTSRSEALDVEDVDAFLEPYLAQLRHHVARTGGVVSTVAGDGMMAVFGAPVAHEDDPERGVRAALGIREHLHPARGRRRRPARADRRDHRRGARRR